MEATEEIMDDDDVVDMLVCFLFFTLSCYFLNERCSITMATARSTRTMTRWRMDTFGRIRFTLVTLRGPRVHFLIIPPRAIVM